jgi:very-short-patch-repair endonuclease
MRFLPQDDPRRRVWEACESPIEQWLCCGLFTLLGCRAVGNYFFPSLLTELCVRAGDAPACYLFSQHKIGRYRVDFLAVIVRPADRTHRLIVIECDGERYHGSPAQQARDRIRNGIFEERGYTVIRYTGSVLFRMMGGVLKEIQAILLSEGVTCATPPDLYGYSALLALFTPNPIVKQVRREARAACDREEELERSRFFEGDGGGSYRWADTI